MKEEIWNELYLYLIRIEIGVFKNFKESRNGFMAKTRYWHLKARSTVYIWTDPITLPCSLARAGNNNTNRSYFPVLLLLSISTKLFMVIRCHIHKLRQTMIPARPSRMTLARVYSDDDHYHVNEKH